MLQLPFYTGALLFDLPALFLMHRFRLLICAFALFLVAEAQAQPNGHIQSSLVRITATEVEPDYRGAVELRARSDGASAPGSSSTASAS